MSNMMSQTIGKAIPASFLAMARRGCSFIPVVLISAALLRHSRVELSKAVADAITIAVAIAAIKDNERNEINFEEPFFAVFFVDFCYYVSSVKRKTAQNSARSNEGRPNPYKQTKPELENMKFEVAREMGVNMTRGYNISGNLSSVENGRARRTVRKMIEDYQRTAATVISQKSKGVNLRWQIRIPTRSTCRGASGDV